MYQLLGDASWRKFIEINPSTLFQSNFFIVIGMSGGVESGGGSARPQGGVGTLDFTSTNRMIGTHTGYSKPMISPEIIIYRAKPSMSASSYCSCKLNVMHTINLWSTLWTQVDAGLIYGRRNQLKKRDYCKNRSESNRKVSLELRNRRGRVCGASLARKFSLPPPVSAAKQHATDPTFYLIDLDKEGDYKHPLAARVGTESVPRQGRPTSRCCVQNS